MGPAGFRDPLGLASGEKRKAGGLGLLARAIERILTVEVPEGEAGAQALGLGIQLGGGQSRLSWAELPWSVPAKSSPFFSFLLSNGNQGVEKDAAKLAV